MQARLFDGPDARVFDTFEVLPAEGQRAVAADEVERRLTTALAVADLDTIKPARRNQPRHLRHFRIAPQIGFVDAADGRRTLLSLVCTDRPGLLADVTQVFRAQRLRVHDARIATFGARAEDVFQLTDERDHALDDARRDALRAALLGPFRWRSTMTVRKTTRKKASTTPQPTPGLSVEELKFHIDSAWERRTMLTPEEIEWATRPSVERVIEGMESGEFRVAEPDGKGGWQVNEWLKKAVLLYFRTRDMTLMEGEPAPFWDKVPLRFQGFGESQFRKLGVRVVPGTVVRRGTYLGKDVVLMPSFVNIGAHVGASTMVDTWATVGSCAQVGKHCHISGGAGIGGVLEPLQASPTIIEDHCFIGARSEVVEGVVVGHHSVIGMGVFLGQSTRIYNRATKEITLRLRAAGFGGRLRLAAGGRRLAFAVLRGDRQAGGCEDACEDLDQRTPCAGKR